MAGQKAGAMGMGMGMGMAGKKPPGFMSGAQPPKTNLFAGAGGGAKPAGGIAFG